MSTSGNVVIIGGGVIGAACAERLSKANFSVCVLEQDKIFGHGVTSRNSGVIHAGLYYPPQSLKSLSCIRGNALLYEWCERYGVPHRKTGKWVIGLDEEVADLEKTFNLATSVGAPGVRWASPEELDSLKTQLHVTAALYSQQTGIVDPIELTRSLITKAQGQGAEFFQPVKVIGIEQTPQKNFRLETDRGELEAELIINAGGLHADELPVMVGIDKYKVHPCRGNYFWFDTPERFSKLIYPAKKLGAPGLGIHLTIGLDGRYRLGPDVEWVGKKDDFADPSNVEEKRKSFFQSASRYFKNMRLDQLSYESCGIRPKLRSPQESQEKDFVISEDLPGFVNLVGIESPGLTACLDLADRVLHLIKH